ncbi:MAG: hypothetical protein ABL921_17140 [Pirellula sp.]
MSLAEKKPVRSIDAISWVDEQAGDLPILLSAPHGGNLDLPGILARSGLGLETGATGFLSGRDNGTEELTRAVSDSIEQRFGKRPYFVISRVHRRFLDPNRPAEIAYDDPSVQPIYDCYHHALRTFVQQMAERFRAGIIIDIHGQGTQRDTVFRGTKDGLSVSRLRQIFGEAAHHGPTSLFGLFHARGWKVHPSLPDTKEQLGFTGGYITQTYGSHKSQPIDAVQLEFGAEFRVPSRRAQTAEVLTDALAEYCNTYLKMKVA